MRLLAIINPAAGRENFQREIYTMLSSLKDTAAYSEIDFRYTQGLGHASTLTQEEGGNYDIIVAVGGDGTVHEVVNGLMQAGHNTPVSIVAAGTVNDFASAINLPVNTEDIRQMLLTPRTFMIDLGFSGGNYFFNVCAGGMLTDVAYRTTRTSKTVLGRLAYILNAATDLPARLFRPLNLSIETDNDKITGPMYLFMAANTRSVGGFRKIAPASVPNDGLLDIIAIRAEGPAPISSMASLLVKTINCSHVEHRNFYYKQSTKATVIELDNKETLLDMDGEQKGALPVTIEVVPAVFPLVVPQDYQLN
ncbi:MAG TPA: diacylglycerol kinase family lipid kinase [Clostridiaceae bacterium]|nr:diacylglycerol kinase family lipid kinase [Clostridiaceae bacterium]